MRGSRGAGRRLWRWRSSPLRRHDDVMEAWVVLVMWTVVLVGGALAGLVTAHAAAQVSARERAERHAVPAVVLASAVGSASAAGGPYRIQAEVRWTAPDGTARTERTLVPTGTASGATLTLWQDDRGALVPEPTGVTEGAVEAGMFGAAAALAVAGAAFGTGTLVRWRLDRRRCDLWAGEWERVGPRWSQRTG